MYEYFQSEMQHLHDSAQEFAEVYPKQASMLNLKSMQSKDPHIERLLEGTAYLTAHIQRRLDDDLSEFSDCMVHHLWPEILKPYPSALIAKFSPVRNQLVKTYVLPKGSKFVSPAVGPEKITCEFKTSASIKINPIHIIHIESIKNQSQEEVLKIHLKTDSNIEFSELDLPGLEFYISGEVNSALQLYWMLSAEVKQVMLTPDKEKTIYLGSQEVIQPSHLSSQNSICPNSPRSFSGFRVLHDYFSFMEKFLFIKIMNLEKLIWPKQCHECVIEITFKKQEGSSLNMNTAQLQINCVPAVNLYSATSEPIAYTGERYQYIVHPDISYEDSVNIYSVDSVTGVDPRTLNQFQYIEFPNISKENQSDGFYQIKKQGLGKNKEVLYLRLTDKNKMPQTLSCKLTVSNGCYPHLYIHENTEMMTASDLPRFLQVRNLTKPSPFLLNPNKKGTTWEFLKHWTINRDSLSNIENLKSLLNSYHWGCQYDHNNRIDGLHKITMSLKNKIKNGVFQQGVNIQLEVDEALYFGFGDIYCFGSVLHQLFIEYVAMNWFLDMQLICIPSGKEFLWKTDSGKLWPI